MHVRGLRRASTNLDPLQLAALRVKHSYASYVVAWVVQRAGVDQPGPAYVLVAKAMRVSVADERELLADDQRAQQALVVGMRGDEELAVFDWHLDHFPGEIYAASLGCYPELLGVAVHVAGDQIRRPPARAQHLDALDRAHVAAVDYRLDVTLCERLEGSRQAASLAVRV